MLKPERGEYSMGIGDGDGDGGDSHGTASKSVI